MPDKDNDIKVSVYCLAYNHGALIHRALEGFVNQKTNFKYEVIVHDDASTDNTAEVIREYAEKYPDIIKPIYQKENQYKNGILKRFVLPVLKGKYIAACEGDDYWTDSNKLQTQYDILESHPECAVCCHYVKEIDYNTGDLIKYCPRDKYALTEGIIERGKAMEITMMDFIHINSLMYKTDIRTELLNNKPEFAKHVVGDRALLLYILDKGEIYFIDKVMSVYNKAVPGSWTMRIERGDIERLKRVNDENLYGLSLYKQYADEKYSDKIDEITYKLKIRTEFNLLKRTKQYRKLFRRRYRDLINGLPKSTRIKLLICCIIPGFDDLYRKTKKRTKK